MFRRHEFLYDIKISNNYIELKYFSQDMDSFCKLEIVRIRNIFEIKFFGNWTFF